MPCIENCSDVQYLQCKGRLLRKKRKKGGIGNGPDKGIILLKYCSFSITTEIRVCFGSLLFVREERLDR